MFEKRIEIWENTKEMAKEMTDPPTSVKIAHQSALLLPKKYAKSNVSFHNMDAIDLSFTFPNSVILNLSDDIYPGGSVDLGSGAQEESLFRRTNYHKTLLECYYPLKKADAVYSSHVSLFKESEANNWAKMPYVRYVNFIACPGLKYPQTEKKNHKRLTLKNINLLKKKIATVIQIAVQYKYNTIILGAMGCGAWHNPAEHVAEIFKEVLDENDGCIENYAFAILSTSVQTIDIFKQAFAT
jgi:uncharacterized protein (TIGR02452 family)